MTAKFEASETARNTLDETSKQVSTSIFLHCIFSTVKFKAILCSKTKKGNRKIPCCALGCIGQVHGLPGGERLAAGVGKKLSFHFF